MYTRLRNTDHVELAMRYKRQFVHLIQPPIAQFTSGSDKPWIVLHFLSQFALWLRSGAEDFAAANRIRRMRLTIFFPPKEGRAGAASMLGKLAAIGPKSCAIWPNTTVALRSASICSLVANVNAFIAVL